MSDITVNILESIRADIADLKDHFEARFDALDERFDRTNERIDRVDHHLTERIDRLDHRLSARIDRTHEQLESIVNLMGMLARNHGSLEARVTALEDGSKA